MTAIFHSGGKFFGHNGKRHFFRPPGGSRYAWVTNMLAFELQSFHWSLRARPVPLVNSFHSQPPHSSAIRLVGCAEQCIHRVTAVGQMNIHRRGAQLVVLARLKSLEVQGGCVCLAFVHILFLLILGRLTAMDVVRNLRGFPTCPLNHCPACRVGTVASEGIGAGTWRRQLASNAESWLCVSIALLISCDLSWVLQ